METEVRLLAVSLVKNYCFIREEYRNNEALVRGVAQIIWTLYNEELKDADHDYSDTDWTIVYDNCMRSILYELIGLQGDFMPKVINRDRTYTKARSEIFQIVKDWCVTHVTYSPRIKKIKLNCSAPPPPMSPEGDAPE